MRFFYFFATTFISRARCISESGIRRVLGEMEIFVGGVGVGARRGASRGSAAESRRPRVFILSWVFREGIERGIDMLLMGNGEL